MSPIFLLLEFRYSILLNFAHKPDDLMRADTSNYASYPSNAYSWRVPTSEEYLGIAKLLFRCSVMV